MLSSPAGKADEDDYEDDDGDDKEDNEEHHKALSSPSSPPESNDLHEAQHDDREEHCDASTLPDSNDLYGDLRKLSAPNLHLAPKSFNAAALSTLLPETPLFSGRRKKTRRSA